MSRSPQEKGVMLIGHAILLIIVLVMLFPHLIMMITSLKSIEELYSLSFFPKNPWFGNYVEIWSKIPLLYYLRNSLIIASGATLITVVLALPTAYAIVRMRFKGCNVLLYATMSLKMFGPVIIIIGLFKAIRLYNLIDTYSSLILVNAVFALPIAIWLLCGYIRGITGDLDDAAKIDGASDLQILFRVIVPIAKPAILSVIIITFINSWNEYICALTFISNQYKKPLPVGLSAFIGIWEIQWNHLMGGAIISTIPTAVLLFFLMRKMTGGMMVGAIK